MTHEEDSREIVNDTSQIEDDLTADEFGIRQEALSKLTPEELTEEDAQCVAPGLLSIIDGDDALLAMNAETKLIRLAQATPTSLAELDQTSISRVLDLVDDSDSDARASLVRALGTSAHMKAIKDLDNRYENEVQKVQDAIEDGLSTAADRILTEIKNHDVDASSDAARGLLYLSRYQPGRLIPYESTLFELLENENGDLVGDALVNILRTDTRHELSVETLTEAAEISPDVPEERFEAAKYAVDALVRTESQLSAIESISNRYLSWLDTDDENRRRRALAILTPIATHAPTILDEGIDAIGTVASDDGMLTDAAGTVIRQWAGAKVSSPQAYLKQLLEAAPSEPALPWLADSLDVLKYQTDDGWESITLDTIGRDTHTRLQTVIEDSRSIPVAWPVFEPQMVMTLTVGCLLEGATRNRDTVLYSRGTSKHWGYKTDLRGEYRRYGLALPDLIDTQHRVTSLETVLPHGYVYDGTRKLDAGPESAPATLWLLDQSDDLDHVTDAATILFNGHARVTPEQESLFDDIATGQSDTAKINTFSLYTKNEFEGNRVPRYGLPTNLDTASTLPDVRALQQVLESTVSDETSSGSPMLADASFEDLATSRDIQIDSIDAEPVRPYLEEGYDAVNDLLEFDAEHAGWRAFSYLQRFERLPVPADRYDSWIRARRRGTERGRMSYTTDEYLGKLARFREDVEFMAQAGISDVKEQLEFIVRTLEQQNPLYERLQDRVDDALTADTTLAIYTPTRSFRKALKQCLLEDGIIDRADLQDGRLEIHDADSLREMGAVDTLIVAGPQRRQHAGYLLHPAASTIEVLTYDGRWERMVERHAQGFVDELNEVFQEGEYNPIPEPDVSLRGPKPIDEDAAPDDDLSESDAEIGSSTGSGSKAGFQERLAQSLEGSRMADRYATDRDRYEYEQREFRIETASGEQLLLESGQRAIVENNSEDGVRYNWVSPIEFMDDEVIVQIDDEMWNRLWDDWLDEQYADVGGGLTTHLETWYAVVTEILEETRADLDAKVPDEKVYQYLADEAKEGGIERGKNRINEWFRSVDVADGPLDLARDAGLTMAPGEAEDIQQLGEIFDRSELTGTAGQRIDEGLRKIRGAHIHEGRAFRDHIQSALNEQSALGAEILDSATRYEVARVTEVSD
ncbi:hypothetical protein [Halorubellus salinus]|uniref:hypothetical protein n=1 Tax=Halorubellus salinus TaxID=755309 RepID=UPI001D082C8E|nr:hypothetical protein [Halorubellus salinus]